MKKVIVIKIGGKQLLEIKKRKTLLRNILSLSKKYSVLVIHGGKHQINDALKGKTPKFVNGQRYTDAPTLNTVTETLARVNKELVREFNSMLNGRAVGLCGIDGETVKAKRIKSLGYVGKINDVNVKLLTLLLTDSYVPFIFPVSSGEGTILNINADNAASAIAIALKAEKLIFISDVPGIFDKNGRIINGINSKTVKYLKKENIVTEGMIPKVDGCLSAIKKGVKEIYITDKIVFLHGALAVPGTRLIR